MYNLENILILNMLYILFTLIKLIISIFNYSSKKDLLKNRLINKYFNYYIIEYFILPNPFFYFKVNLCVALYLQYLPKAEALKFFYETKIYLIAIGKHHLLQKNILYNHFKFFHRSLKLIKYFDHHRFFESLHTLLINLWVAYISINNLNNM